MKLHDSKDQFYMELEQKIKCGEITSKELVDFISSCQGESSEMNSSEFYELCSAFADISLNAPKLADSKTCDVQACFQYKDIEDAKVQFNNYVKKNELKDIGGILDAIGYMHSFAVAWDDPREKSGIVHPDGYDWNSAFAGKYYNFCELPDDIWQKIKNEILEGYVMDLPKTEENGNKEFL